MVTYCISSDCVALLLPAEEGAPVRALVSDCLRSAGLRPWQDMEAELFSSPVGRLLIARPRAPLRQRTSPSVCRLTRR